MVWKHTRTSHSRLHPLSPPPFPPTPRSADPRTHLPRNRALPAHTETTPRGVEGRPRPIRRAPCACVHPLKKEDRCSGLPAGGGPPAVRRRQLAVGCSIRSTCSLPFRLLPLAISFLLQTETKSDSTSVASLTEGLPGLDQLEEGRKDHL